MSANNRHARGLPRTDHITEPFWCARHTLPQSRERKQRGHWDEKDLWSLLESEENRGYHDEGKDDGDHPFGAM
jgi:hypothetical protein